MRQLVARAWLISNQAPTIEDWRPNGCHRGVSAKLAKRSSVDPRWHRVGLVHRLDWIHSIPLGGTIAADSACLDQEDSGDSEIKPFPQSNRIRFCAGRLRRSSSDGIAHSDSRDSGTSVSLFVQSVLDFLGRLQADFPCGRPGFVCHREMAVGFSTWIGRVLALAVPSSRDRADGVFAVLTARQSHAGAGTGDSRFLPYQAACPSISRFVRRPGVRLAGIRLVEGEARGRTGSKVSGRRCDQV